MKNKKVKYLLIFVVAIIWGLIFYKVIVMFRGSNPEIVTSNIKTNKNKSDMKADTFRIIANYPDPFITRKYNRLNINPENKKVKAENMQKTVSAQSKLIWPGIKYAGVVSDYSGNKSTVLVIINGINYLMKKGEIKGEVELTTITKDSLKLKYKDEYKFIKRNGVK